MRWAVRLSVVVTLAAAGFVFGSAESARAKGACLLSKALQEGVPTIVHGKTTRLLPLEAYAECGVAPPVDPALLAPPRLAG